MPQPTSAGETAAADKWQETTPDLPSFYSPRSQPAREEAPSTSASTTSTSTTTPADTTSASAPPPVKPNPAPDHLSLDGPSPQPTPPTPTTAPPPPSLLSPAFTPPTTPGTPTPGDAQRLRSVPVDSTIPTGGAGSKRPRLLETLPEVQCIVRARIPTVSGTEMFLHLYTNNVDNKEHLAIVFGPHIRSTSLDAPREGETEMDRMIRGAYTGTLYPGRTDSRSTAEEKKVDGSGSGGSATPLVRIHSECYTGETAWSARCDCGEQLDEAARLMSHPDNTAGGIIIYLRQEGRGIGLGEKLKAYNLQDLGSDTVEANLLLRHPADARSYGLATAMLLDLGQREVRLLTNNPDKIRAVEGPGREVVVRERVAMVPLSWKGKGGFKSREVEAYLETKVSFFLSLFFFFFVAVRGSRLTNLGNYRSRRWGTC